MTYSLTLRNEAERDIEEHFEYYEGKREGLGRDFLLCIEAALDKLQRNPLSYRKIYKDLRRIPIHRFPYRILFWVQTNQIIVTATFHARKDPISWGTRT